MNASSPVAPESIPTSSQNSSDQWTLKLTQNGPLIGALVLRTALGIVFIAHALLKLLVFTLPGTAQFFTAHGFPGWAAYPVFAFELIGGVLLILGIFTRTVALILIPIMFGAFLVHWPNGWSFVAQGGGWEYVAFLIAALLAQVGLGSGTWALRYRQH